MCNSCRYRFKVHDLHKMVCTMVVLRNFHADFRKGERQGIGSDSNDNDVDYDDASADFNKFFT